MSGCVPVLPAYDPPLVWPPMASKRHFCARVQQGGGEAKTQNRRKGHLQARRSVLSSGSVPIFPHLKTPHRGPQSAPQRIKQPRPAPSWRKPGHFHLFRAMDSTAQRSLSASHHAQRGPSHCPPMYSTRGGSPSARNLITPVFSVAARSGAGSRFQKPSTGGRLPFSGHSFPRVSPS